MLKWKDRLYFYPCVTNKEWLVLVRLYLPIAEIFCMISYKSPSLHTIRNTAHIALGTNGICQFLPLPPNVKVVQILVSSLQPTLKEGKGSVDFGPFPWLGWLWACAPTWLCLIKLGSDWSVRLHG